MRLVGHVEHMSADNWVSALREFKVEGLTNPGRNRKTCQESFRFEILFDGNMGWMVF